MEREGRINNIRFWSRISKFVEKAEGVFEDLVGVHDIGRPYSASVDVGGLGGQSLTR